MNAALGCAAFALTCLSATAATLVSRYSFSGTNGTNVVDSVGGYTGTLRGAAAFDGSGSVVLDGTSGTYVSLPPAQLSGLTALTIDAWFTYTVPNNNVHLFSIDNGGGTGSGGSYLRYNVYDSGASHGGTNYFEGIISWGGNVLHGGSVLPQAVTNHVTLIYDPAGGVKAIYVNGVLSSSYNGTLAALSSYPQTVFTLGRSPWANSGDPYLKGAISEFRVYSGVLSESDIAANDAAGPDSIPTITVGVPQFSPTNAVYDGESVVLSCGVSGPATGHYWEWDNGSAGASFTPISGANSLTYTQDTTGLSAGYQFQYRFVATNSSSSVTSDVVTLTVNPASAPTVTVDTTPNYAARYTGGEITFSAGFEGNHPLTNQWQMSTNGGVDWFNLAGQTNTSLALTNLQFDDAGMYRLAATNAIGGNVSSGATLVVNDSSTAKFHWSAPISIVGRAADEILTNVSGSVVGAAVFGNTARAVTLGNGRIINFKSDGSVATVTGNGTATGAYPAGTGLTTSNADFDAVLNQFNWDGGPKTITLYNLQVGEQYSVQLFALDNRDTGAGESNRLASFQDVFDEADVSPTFKMGDNAYIVGTFTASSSVESIQENLPTGNNGNMNALVLRALSFTPTNQPPVITQDPQAKTVFAGHPLSFTAAADSYVVPTWRWQNGPAGGPYTNLADGGVISGATSNVLALSDATGYDGSEFRAMVSNPDGSATTLAAQLTVVPAPPMSGSVASSVLALGPVAYWPLNETNDPALGGQGVYDAAGAHDGTYLTAAQNAANGVVGVQPADGYAAFATNQGALQSTGNTDQSWATTPALNLNTNTATIGMWIYPDGIQPSAVGLLVNRNSGTVAGLGYYNNDRLGYKWNNDGNSTWSFNSGLLIPTNVWSYVAVVVEPTQAILYLYNTNGLQTATNFTAHTSMSWGGSQSNIRIGSDNSVATTFNGKIDEVTVFNRALSQSEVLTLAGMTAPPELTIERSGTALVLTWSAGHLLEADALTGPWTTNAVATSPYTNTPTGAQKFFRAVAP
ncbi:MAG TPA: LamG-like jellyroll fold domain-containing protein [Verrucomicrobiae bacterium]|nr:LamG-like jellyroll fold domain-containing protein [Verrucomicrobiae bacterium]